MESKLLAGKDVDVVDRSAMAKRAVELKRHEVFEQKVRTCRSHLQKRCSESIK